MVMSHTFIGVTMREASQDFAADPFSGMKRGAMVRAARALLSAVTRLLILADMVDVHLLMKSLRLVINVHLHTCTLSNIMMCRN